MYGMMETYIKGQCITSISNLFVTIDTSKFINTAAFVKVSLEKHIFTPKFNF